MSLSPGGYDLAEWTSLHPAVRAANPPLLAAFLLRLPLVCIALIAAFSAPRRFSALWIIHMLFIIGTAIALLPPLEFFTIFRDDPNYRQQFTLSLIALIGGAIGLSGLLRRWHEPVFMVVVTAIIGAAASIIGLLQAYQLVQQFALPVNIGLGVVLIVAAFATIVVVSALKIKQGSISYPVNS